MTADQYKEVLAAGERKGRRFRRGIWPASVLREIMAAMEQACDDVEGDCRD